MLFTLDNVIFHALLLLAFTLNETTEINWNIILTYDCLITKSNKQKYSEVNGKRKLTQLYKKIYCTENAN